MGYKAEDNITVDNIKYDETKLSDMGEKFIIRDVWMPKASAWSPVYTKIDAPFSIDHFTSPRLPVDLGPMDVSFVEETPRVLRCTIKPVNSLEVSLPEELKPAKEFIRNVLEYERMINPSFENCEVHITTDKSEVVKETTQRFPGWHVDGLQGGKFKNKLLAEHSYVISNINPTEFCAQPFFIKHLDEDITNLFKAFDQQTQEVNILRGLENHLYLMDAYMVHRTPIIREEGKRHFVRITVANAPLPIEFNTLNPMLKQKRPEFKLDIRDWLRPTDLPVNYDYYGLDSKKEKTETDATTTKQVKAKQDTGEFDTPILTTGEIIKTPNWKIPKVQPMSPTYRDITEPFTPKKYTNPRIPIDLGTVNIPNIQKCPNVLRMPLKWWNSEEIKLPNEFKTLKPLIERVFAYDKQYNPNYVNQVAHITHDSRIVEKGLTHRFPGFHGDDLQGGSFPIKETAAHSYIVTTNPGTEFCLQSFFVDHLEDTHERVFSEFDKQAKEENIYVAKGGHLYLMDPYSVHRTPLEAGEGIRTFLRITFSTPNMLLPNETKNPMFKDKEQEYNNLPVPHLNETYFTRASDKEIPYNYYGFQL